MEESFNENTKLTKYRKFIPYVVLVVCLSLSSFVWQVWSNSKAEKEHTTYEAKTNQIISDITERLNLYRMLLQGGRGVFASSEDVTRDMWRRYCESRQILTYFPSVQGLGFARVIQPSELAQHIKGIKAEGFPDYTVWPSGERDVYTAIVFLEPCDARNQQAFGYDMFSEPVRRAAMERAAYSNMSAISGKVTLVQEIDEDVQAGFLMYVPIYMRGMPLNSVEERRAALKGWVYSPFRMNNLMQGVIPDSLQDIDFEIYDGTELSQSTLMYKSDASRSDQTKRHKPMFASQRTIDFYGHQWTLAFETSPLFEASFDRYSSKGILASGILISLLFFFFIRAQENTNRQALSLARKMTSALRQSKEEYRVLSDSLPVGVSLIGMNMEILAANTIIRKWFPKVDYMQHPPCYAAYNDPPRTEPCVGCPVIMAFQDGQVHSTETEATTTLGTRVIFSTATPLLGSDGKIISVHETVEDITERKQAEDALRKSEASLAEAQRIAQIGNWQWDISKNTLEWSDEIYRIFGLKPKEVELSYESFLNFIHPDDREYVDQLVEEAIKGTKPYSIDHRVILPDGTERFVHEQAKIIRDENGNPVRMLGTVHNITERKQAEEKKAQLEEQYRQIQKMESVGRLAGGVAHDYNNMLSVILGYLELAEGNLDSGKDISLEIEEIKKATYRSIRITQQLLAFSRKQTISPKVIDLNNIVESMLKMLERLLGENIDIAWFPDNSIFPIRIDPSQVDQIMVNLCVNAKDAIEDVGKITIESGTRIFSKAYCSTHVGFVPGEFVMLTISDDGCGMNAEILEHAFEPFYTTKEQGKGTGLGLATVYGIVKQNSGFINIYSEPGQGTNVKIYFPRADAPIESAQDDDESDVETRGNEIVLIVEDEKQILDMIKTMLEHNGYAVLDSNSPVEALQIAKEHADEIDVLITDVVMPEMNGRKLAQKVQELNPSIKVLFISGYTENAIAHQGVLDEGVSFLQKPFSQKELAAKLRKIIDK